MTEYKIHITFADGTWRVDTYMSLTALLDAVLHETREVVKGKTKVFAVYQG